MAGNSKRLGKGLGAIFGEDIDSVINDIASNNDSEIKGDSSLLKISEIRTNPYQPRKHFDEEALKELSLSIKEHGVFQPILVRKSSISGYELIAGERRLRASKLAKLKEIPAIVLDFDDKAMMEISLLENVQREDLSVIEEAEAYEKLIKNLDYTQEELAKRLGKSRTHITNILRLLKLPAEIREMLDKNLLSFGHARALVNIEDEELQKELAQKVLNDDLSVREIEKLAQKAKKDPKPQKEKKEDPFIANVRHTLANKLATRVELSNKAITIHFNNTDDLNRILEAMGALEED